MTDIEQLGLIKKNMDQSEFYGVLGANIGRAFASVILILGAFISMRYLYSINNPFVWLTFIIAIPSLVIGYIKFSKLSSFSEFLITDTITPYDNNMTLIKSQFISWVLAVGVDIIVVIAMMLLSGLEDPLSMAILKITVLSVIAIAFFLFTKREDIWTKNGFAFDTFFGYAVLGIAFGFSTYAIGGVIVIASTFIGWELTLLGVGLEVVFTSIYTYMDLQYWVNDYKRRQMSQSERDAYEQEEKENREIASRLSGRY